MIQKDSTPLLHIKEGVVIENSILEKIKMLSMNRGNSSIPNDIKSMEGKNFEIKKNEIAEKINNLEYKNELMVWNINDSFCLIPESSASKTSIQDRKNNIDQIIKYLDEKYKDNYLVLTFRKTRITNLFKRCLTFDDIQKYDMRGCYNLAQICNFWLNSGEKKVIVIELKKGFESQELFMISCMLAYSKFYLSAETALNALLVNNQSIWTFSNVETIGRYVKYYDFAITHSHINKMPQIILNQMIVTTIPSIIQSGDFIPKLKIEINSKTVEFSDENCYKDLDYIIFSNLECEISNDVKFSLVFEQENKTYQVFDLWINSLFYNQGLYRFSRSEVITSLPQDSIYKFFQDGFYIDLVFLENHEENIKNPFSVPLNMLDLINLMINKISNDCSDEDLIKNSYAKMLDQGFNPFLAKLCSQLQLNNEESLRLHKKLEESGYKSGILRQNFEIKQSEEIIKEQLKIERSESKAINIEALLDKLEALDIKEIELITNENILKENIKRPLFDLFNKTKSSSTVMFETKDNLFAKKPLHLIPIKRTENTIFDELKNLNVFIDLNIIEKAFCENANALDNPKEKSQSSRKYKISEKRIFMVSLLFKQLDIKKIFIDNLEEILKNQPERLGIEEISNLYKILPSIEEKILIEQDDDIENSEFENKMLKLSKISKINEILNILKFERECIEEIIQIEKLLDCTNDVIYKILNDINLKYIFKTILDLSNILNYTYGRKKKISEGFKIESLYFLNAYKESNDKSLVDFVCEILRSNNISYHKIFKNFRELATLKNEDFSGLKEKINIIITKYNEVYNNFKHIEEYNSSFHFKLISFAYKRLLGISEKYKNLEKNSNLLRNKLGEEDKKPINNIFKSFSDFFISLEASENRIKKK